YDDWDAFIHVGHPTSMLLGAGLSIGESTGASGKELLKAYVLGIEVMCKLAQLSEPPRSGLSQHAGVGQPWRGCRLCELVEIGRQPVESGPWHRCIGRRWDSPAAGIDGETIPCR